MSTPIGVVFAPFSGGDDASTAAVGSVLAEFGPICRGSTRIDANRQALSSSDSLSSQGRGTLF